MQALRAQFTGLRDWWRRLWAQAPLDLRGERAAAKYLKRLGYRILAARDRSGLGEIDLVALDGQTIVFVEVKTRDSAENFRPEYWPRASQPAAHPHCHCSV